MLSGFERLELSTETLRELTGDELESVAGGRPDTTLNTSICATYTLVCPSGNTWTANCQTIQTGA